MVIILYNLLFEFSSSLIILGIIFRCRTLFMKHWDMVESTVKDAQGVDVMLIFGNFVSRSKVALLDMTMGEIHWNQITLPPVFPAVLKISFP